MHNILGWVSRLVTARPWFTLLGLLIVTIVMGMGSNLREPPLDTEGTLPRDSAVAKAMTEIDELFGDSGEVRVVTLLFRGETLTPGGLSQMDGLIAAIVGDPEVGNILAPGAPVFAPSLLVKAAIQVDSLDAVTQEQIDSVHGVPGIGETLALLTGIDADGTPVAVGSIRLHDTGDERVVEAERRINELAVGNAGPLRVSTVSFVVIEDEIRRGTEGMGPLIGMALLLIAALIVLFMRTVSDLVLTLVGLFVSIMWVMGMEGWLGPKGLGVVGPPNTLTAMVPIVVIGLTVDYAIQAVSHYREQRVASEAVAGAARLGLRNVTVPLLLAAVTTIVSLMVGLFSPVEIVGDFGVVGGLGVGLSLVVMLTLIPAGRTIIDRRREARGTLRPPRPISNALPGINRTAGFVGRQITRRPAPYIVAVLAVTIALGFASRGLESEFSIRDLLPSGGGVLEDITTLDAAVGGSTENASVLLVAEATETRTLLNLHEFRDAFEDEQRRPEAAAGPLQISYESLVEDWTHDSGQPGDKYDPQLEALYRQATADVRLDPALMQQILDRIETRDPALRHSLVNDRDGVDTILLQFPASTGDPGASKRLQEDVASVWSGDAAALTVTSDSIIAFEVTDAIRDRQTASIGTTVAAALIVLAVFFWLTVRQPALAVIAVTPTVLVLISVLGTMALLGIPYTITTSIITALSIGIGVDYTIHMIHRYREEFARWRNPERAAVRTLETTGSALLGSALTTALGIGVMAFSPLAAMQQFGITAAITIAYSLVFSVLLVPPAMTVWGAFQNMRLRSATERQWVELDVAIEEIYQRHEREEG